MIRRNSKAFAAIEEARELLHGVSFSHPEDIYLRGSVTSVVISGRPGEEERLTVVISCYRPGHLVVEWQELAVFLHEEPDGACRLTFPDESGRAEFPAARPGSLRLGSSLTSARLAFPGPASSEIASSEIRVSETLSFDSLVAAKVFSNPAGPLEAEFRTRDQGVAQGTVHLECASNGGGDWIGGEGYFEPDQPIGWVSYIRMMTDSGDGLRVRFAVRQPLR
jgi:hypothetical protein